MPSSSRPSSKGRRDLLPFGEGGRRIFQEKKQETGKSYAKKTPRTFP